MAVEHPELVRLFQVMARLRAPGGCPWDRAQTHRSLLPFLLAEVYETIQAVEQGGPEELAEELGDLLVEIGMQAAIAAEEDGFGLEEAASRATAKMISRHPHVFGDATVSSQEELLRNWDSIKRTEKPARSSALDGIPASLPALALASTAQARAGRAGLAGSPPLAGDELRPLVARLAEASTADAPALEELVGELLWAVVAEARRLGVDPETALRERAQEWMESFRSRELAAEGQEGGGKPA